MHSLKVLLKDLGDIEVQENPFFSPGPCLNYFYSGLELRKTGSFFFSYPYSSEMRVPVRADPFSKTTSVQGLTSNGYLGSLGFFPNHLWL
jgi:hypothetical protein